MSTLRTDKPATIYDVAELANVSHITVSRVVNGKQNVSDKTRERVLQAMDQLGYVPNIAAQALPTGRARSIELITTDIWGSGAPAMQPIISEASAHNYQFSVLPTTLANLPQVLSTAPSRLVAGSILYSQDIDLDCNRIETLTQGVPFVHMGGKLHSSLASVTYDQYHAAQTAVQYLIDCGHRDIGFIGGWQNLLDNQQRLDGWRDTLRANGLPEGVLTFGNFGAVSGAAAMERILALGKAFTAMFIASDQMAIGAIHTLHAAGLSVPGDVSIVGYDDTTFAPFIDPPLTTVTNDFTVLGELAIKYLLELMDRPDTSHYQRIINPKLIIRASTRELR